MSEIPQNAMGEDHRFLLLLTEKSNNSELGCWGQLDMKWKDKFRSLWDQFLNAIRAFVLNPQSYWIWKMKTLLLISCLVLEKAMAPHSSTLAWKTTRMEEPGRLQSMWLLGVGYDWVTSLSLLSFMHWRRKWQPTPVFLPGESHGQRRLEGFSPWVAKSQTWLSN